MTEKWSPQQPQNESEERLKKYEEDGIQDPEEENDPMGLGADYKEQTGDAI